MSAIKEAAAAKAIQFLTAAGLAYAIQMPDGSFAGSLNVQPAKTKHKNWRQYGYIDVIRTMEAGQGHEFPMPQGAKPSEYGSVISGAGIQQFGKGYFMVATSKCGKFIEALRVA